MNRKRYLLPLAASLFAFSASFAQKSNSPNTSSKQRAVQTTTNATALNTAKANDPQMQANIKALILQLQKRVEQEYRAQRKNLTPRELAYIDSVKASIDARIRSLSQPNSNAPH